MILWYYFWLLLLLVNPQHHILRRDSSWIPFRWIEQAINIQRVLVIVRRNFAECLFIRTVLCIPVWIHHFKIKVEIIQYRMIRFCEIMLFDSTLIQWYWTLPKPIKQSKNKQNWVNILFKFRSKIKNRTTLKIILQPLWIHNLK